MSYIPDFNTLKKAVIIKIANFIFGLFWSAIGLLSKEEDLRLKTNVASICLSNNNRNAVINEFHTDFGRIFINGNKFDIGKIVSFMEIEADNGDIQVKGIIDFLKIQDS